MNSKKLLKGFAIIFAVTLFVSIGVTFLWNIIFHDITIIDWETSFRFAIIFGILYVYLDAKRNVK